MSKNQSSKSVKIKAKYKVLKNGLRAVAVPMKESPTVTVLVLVAAGSHYEAERVNGISHFLEHMCFKGTVNRPSPSVIAHELDGLGAESNAFTWYEFTGYYAKARSGNFAKIFDVVADLYLNPLIQNEELDKERGVIIEEINMYEDLPMQNVGRLLDEVMYGDQPAGRSVLGTEKHIRSLRREDFVNYRNKHYVPRATVVIVAGAVEPSEVFAQVEKYFNTLKNLPLPKKPPVKDKQARPQLKVRYKKSKQAHFQIGFRSLNASSKELPVLAVLKTILGQGVSSRLFRKLREEMGVCYYVKANTEHHSDHGKFVISSGVDISRIETVLKVIIDELRLLINEPVGDDELRKAKEYYLGNFAMGLESSDEVAEYFGVQEVLNLKREPLHKYISAIKKVTAEDVRKLAKRLFKNNSLNFAVIGPYKSSEQFMKVLKL